MVEERYPTVCQLGNYTHWCIYDHRLANYDVSYQVLPTLPQYSTTASLDVD
jgi:hypothetical protein